MPDTAPPAPEPPAAPPAGRSLWAQQELGSLVARAWADPDPAAPAPVPEPALAQPETSSGWEVERLPSEEEGGIVSLMLGGAQKSADARPADTLPSAPLVPGLARLTEMLEQLPVDPTPRVTPEDVAVDAPTLAPPAVWFWGDDDIYPGKLAGVPDGPRARAKPVPVRRSWKVQLRAKR